MNRPPTIPLTGQPGNPQNLPPGARIVSPQGLPPGAIPLTSSTMPGGFQLPPGVLQQSGTQMQPMPNQPGLAPGGQYMVMTQNGLVPVGAPQPYIGQPVAPMQTTVLPSPGNQGAPGQYVYPLNTQ